MAVTMEDKLVLLNKYEAHTAEGRALADEIAAAVRPIIQRMAVQGASSVEIEHIAIQQITAACAELRLSRAIGARMAERAAAKKSVP